MKIKIEYAIITAVLVIIAFASFGNYLSLGTQSYVDIRADAPTEINYASIILVNPTDCCTPTIQVTTPWDSVETMKIAMGQTITLVNEDDNTEKYIIKSIGEGIQLAVPGSGFYEDTVTSVRLDTSYVAPAPTIMCPALYDPVCGVDGITYTNSCKADVAGVEIDYYSACGTVTPTPTETATETPTATPTNGNLSGENLLWGGAFVGIFIIVIIAVRGKK